MSKVNGVYQKESKENGIIKKKPPNEKKRKIKNQD